MKKKKWSIDTFTSRTRERFVAEKKLYAAAVIERRYCRRRRQARRRAGGGTEGAGRSEGGLPAGRGRGRLREG